MEAYSDHLAYAEVGRTERITAACVAALAAAGVLFVAPVGSRHAGEAIAFLPAVQSLTAFVMLLTATLLGGQFVRSRHAPFAYLAGAYAAASALIVAQLLVFPRVFAPAGLFGAGPQTAAWLYTAWHLAFFIPIAMYVVAERRASMPDRAPLDARRLCLALGTAVALTIGAALRFEPRLPQLVVDLHFTALWTSVVAPGLLLCNLGLLVALAAVTRLRSVVHVWLAVVLVAALAELVAVWMSPARFSYAWYFARLELFLSASTFYFVLKFHLGRMLIRMADDHRALAQSAVRDPLTGLLNRRGFEHGLADAQRRCRRAAQPLAVLAVDIDEFKLFNDAFGHPSGDAALRSVGEALATCVRRPGDLCARTGGEEFVVLLAETTLAGASVVAENVRRRVEALQIAHAPASGRPWLTVSVGLSSNEDHLAMTTAELLVRSDVALYRAKSNGRNRVSRFGESVEAIVTELRATSDAIKRRLAFERRNDGLQETAR